MVSVCGADLPPVLYSPGMSSRAPFPSLVITEQTFIPQGSFAVSQAEYLSPDPAEVQELNTLLSEKKIGVVAHFYMDPELQGTLSACDWPHVGISDSLKMADAAIGMVEAGCESVIVLGVDFMSENARAILDAAGHRAIPVYRVAAEPIGCSLAESAESDAYLAYLEEAAAVDKALHVVYINTSLRTKGTAHAIVPTITCTSSNVVATVLTAFSQVPDLTLFFGPDTYMGANLHELFTTLAGLDDARIREVHPAHDQASMRRVVERFRYFRQGNCIVHHMFGDEVARQVREDYPDVFVSAHLEVPGEMFRVALERERKSDAGVAGSTSNILAFIERKVRAAVQAGGNKRVRFILGTEAGMITSIVNAVRALLREHAGSGVEAEIIFPVASEVITQAPESELVVVPGASGGEGCTTAGGCATCPYMKKNSLTALLDVVRSIGGAEDLSPLYPEAYTERIAGRAAADIGSEPILHMRDFSRDGVLSDRLVRSIISGDTAA